MWGGGWWACWSGWGTTFPCWMRTPRILLEIPAKEKIGRAKYVEADKYVEEYAAISEEMEREIAAIAEKAGDQL